jgi:basic amino acid/polyamine antiporter, APA family
LEAIHIDEIRKIEAAAHNKSTEGLKREIGTWGIFLNVINNTIGSGIFLLPAIIAGFLGPASILVYIGCGILFLLVMLCYAEISSQVSSSGGTYVYIEEAFGPYAGFLANTIFWFGTGVFVMAALVNGMGDILSVAFPVFANNLFRAAAFFVLIALCAWLNIRGVKQGIALIKLITIIKLVPVLLLVIVGFFHLNTANLRIETMPSFRDFGAVSLILFFTFAGGESVLNISGEMKNPRRTAPLGLLFGLLATILIFCAIQIVAQSTLGTSLAQYKEAPLAEVASRLFGPWAHKIIIAASVIAIAGILTSLPLVFSRVMFAGAKNNLLPTILGKVHPRYATPANAIIAFSAIAWLVAISGGFRQLAIIVSASLLLLYTAVVLATIRFRFKETATLASFKIPGGLTVHIAALVALGWFIAQLEKKELVGTAIFVGALSILYVIRVWRQKVVRAAAAIPGGNALLVKNKPGAAG